jgi:Tol biopolymer transport system component
MAATRLAAAVLGAAVLVGPVAATGTAHAAYPGGNGKIVFVTTRDGFNQIYLMNADGSSETSLSGDPLSQYWGPRWSPDGTRVAFVSTKDGNPEIYVMAVEGPGSDTQPITRLTYGIWTDTAPTWSPDGQHLAFSSDRTGHFNIWVMDADGGNQTNLSNNTWYNDEPAWSPDGSRIAFQQIRKGQYKDDIMVMNADGTGVTRLTFTPGGSEVEPAWSPDGSRILYTGFRSPGGMVYVMTADGVRLASFGPGYDPAFSPDGTRILFTSWAAGSGDVWVMNADGSGRARLTDSSALDSAADWQPVQ